MSGKTNAIMISPSSCDSSTSPSQYIHAPDLLPYPIACPVNLPRRANRVIQALGSFIGFSILSYIFITTFHVELLPSPLSINSSEVMDHNQTVYILPPAEAYATFLASTEDPIPWYFNEVRRLLFQVKFDPLTKDSLGRDFVVVASPGVPDYQLAQLEDEGAIVHRRPLIKGLPLPEGLTERYKEVYTKLFVFNMTEYERVLFLDADQLLIKPMSEVWVDVNSWPESGLAACGESKAAWDHPTPIEDQDYFNSGFFLARPNETLFEALIAMRDFDAGLPEQNLLNEYFRRDGQYPWMPLNHKFVTTFPTHVDLEFGIYSLHEKIFLSWVDDKLHEVWQRTLGRMQGYWLANGHGREAREDMRLSQ